MRTNARKNISPTIRHTLCEVAERLESAGIAESVREAETLVCFSCGLTKLDLIREPDRVLSGDGHDLAVALADRRARREPLQHLTATQEFWGLDFAVGPEVLIPRPETEHLIECVLDYLCLFRGFRRGAPRIIDFGTGSGCIAVALATEVPHARIIGIDRSADALAIARMNARRHRVDAKIFWILADSLEGFGDAAADVIVSNPPYVPTIDIDKLEPEVRRYEPRIALDGGPDGLSLIRTIVERAPRLLAPKGLLAIEIGIGQASRVASRAGMKSWESCVTRRDLAGIERVISWVKLADDNG